MRRTSWLACLTAGVMILGLVACSDDDDGAVCGNGVVETGEQCDDGNTVAGDGCEVDCTLSTGECGDGTQDPGEECDDGNTVNGDGCEADCTLPIGECGDSAVEGNEVCDDGNTDDGDGCSANCMSDETCDNGVVDTAVGEECEPPNTATCDANCMNIGGAECDEADSYDTDCETNTGGQWCWDGGSGGALFCGCDPAYGNDDCQLAGYEMCNANTMRCEPAPDCGDDANEDNEDEATATAMTLGTPISGATCGFDPDWFTFTMGSGATSTAAEILISWTDDGETDLDMSVTDCAGTSLGGGSSTDAAQELVSVTELEPGATYCVLVNHYAGAAGGADVSYDIVVNERTSCVLDSQCPANEVCPLSTGLCSATVPANAACGDDVAGDNDTSSLAEVLTSGVAITEGTCDGNPSNPVDVDWFTFTVAAGESLNLEVAYNGDLADGDPDVMMYDANGEMWAVAATEDDPELISGAGLPAGMYYVVVSYYDNDSATPATSTYDITATLAAGTGCADRDDCAAWSERGECTANECVAFDGAGAQGPGDFCDSSDDCDPATTGSQYLTGLCFAADPALGSDNVCVIDCAAEADCTPHGMHCYLINGTDGICLAPCTSDAGCGGGTCEVATGICQ